MSANGPKVTFSDQEKKIFGALYEKNKSGEYSDEKVAEFLSSYKPAIQLRYRTYENLRDKLNASRQMNDGLQTELDNIDKEQVKLSATHSYLVSKIEKAGSRNGAAIQSYTDSIDKKSDKIQFKA